MQGRYIKGLRWWIIALVMCGVALNYLSRSSLSVAMPTLTKELNISTQQYSYVIAAFQGAYTIMQPMAGYVLDLLGTRTGFAIFALGWALANMLHGFASGWLSLAIFRGLLGVTEAAVIPAGLKTVSEWFPDKERSVATGWFNAGTAIGAMIAPPLVVWCILHTTWQIAFVVTGGLSVVWVTIWLLAYRSPRHHVRLAPAEREYIEQGQDPVRLDKASWKNILGSRQFWGIAIPRFLADPAWATFNFWIPLYLSSVRHMSLKEIAMFAWLPFLAADLGSIVGGYLSPLFMRWFNLSVVASRKLVVTTGAMLMCGPACIGLATDAHTAVYLFCIGGFAHQALSGALITLASDVFGKNEVATANGLTGTAAWLGSLCFSLIIGAVATTIGYNPLFVCLALFDVLGAIVVWLILPSRQSDNVSRAVTTRAIQADI
ncbi:MFS transporter [Paraburkholderia bannensis]|uniref:MFS transporter n=1 Tax=Paraburkholderia bannensis TaxID=765414 RepID=UPI002ABDC82B|nr:MFS transporter [Paraburkholderia bannensis]